MTPLTLQFATCFAIAVSFGSFLFARYALSSRSVRSGRARSEIFLENIDYVHLIIFVRDAGQDVLILSSIITRDFIFVWLNVDSFICKKLGYFVYEALHIRETCNLI